MYRYEIDERRKVIVLDMQGTQDGWEAKLMRMEWDNERARFRFDGEWSLIIDLSLFHSVQPPAIKEHRRFPREIRESGLKEVFLIPPADPSVARDLVEGLNARQAADFPEAWSAAGGEDRTIGIPAPENGTHYPAHNPPPMG